MLLIACPYCGERPELEFVHAGEAHVARPPNPSQTDAQDWVNFLYVRANTQGLYAERWRHAHGCGKFFNAIRDTTTDQFAAVYKVGERP
ncbi:MAG: sarcosine oxidase subunit delta [Steroidobacteraceae bacterium]